MRRKILVLDALAGIWPHSLQVLKVIKQFESDKASFEYISCGSAAPAFCTVQESRSQKFEPGKRPSSSTCRDCKFTAKLIESSIHGIRNRQSPEKTFLSSLVDEALLEAEEMFLDGIQRDLAKELDKDVFGTPVVRFALYEVILKFKKKDLNFSDAEFKYFFACLGNAVRFALIGKKFFSKNSNYFACLAYAPQYAMNNSFLHQAHLAGIRVYFIDGNGNIAERSSAIVIWDWFKYQLVRPGLPNWSFRKPNVEISGIDRQRIRAHKNQLVDGRSFSVYSQPTNQSINIYEKYGIDKSKKIWLLALSSLDEAFAAQIIGAYPRSKYPGKVFSNQHEWVRETIEWVRKQSDVVLIVRMHPRDLPNKRENIKSEQATVWEKMLKTLPENVVLNHPLDAIPIRDLLGVSQGFLTGWSSSALEAMDLGIPVVTYDSAMPGYPSSIHLTGESKEDYFKNLRQLTNLAVNTSIQKDSDEWLVFLLNRGSVRLTGRLFEGLRLRGPRWVPRLLNAVDIIFPYLFRPLELLLTVRRTEDGKKIQELVLSHKDSLYDLSE